MSPSDHSPSPTDARDGGAAPPFCGFLDSILVESAEPFAFDGALPRDEARSIWTWVRRDLANDLLGEPLDADAFAAAVPELLVRLRDTVAMVGASRDDDRRLKAQVGGDEAWQRLPLVISALKGRTLLEKARTFGRATNSLQDEAALVTALQAMPLRDPLLAALLMQSTLGHVANPSRLMTAVIHIAGGTSEDVIRRAGFAPFVDALLAHAQNQLHALSPMGAFADIDLTCRIIDRFHRLLRAIHTYLELNRDSQWSRVLATLTKTASERISPKLGEVAADVNQSLRRPREGADRVDSDRLLAALNGVYLLVTVRDCRDSLAVNALFEATWTQVGEALEFHVQRNLELLRADPSNAIAGERLEMGIKMAELRFNAEYAEVLRRARDAAERRTASPE